MLAALAFDLAKVDVAQRLEQAAIEGEAALERGGHQVEVIDCLHRAIVSPLTRPPASDADDARFASDGTAGSIRAASGRIRRPRGHRLIARTLIGAPQEPALSARPLLASRCRESLPQPHRPSRFRLAALLATPERAGPLMAGRAVASLSGRTTCLHSKMVPVVALGKPFGDYPPAVGAADGPARAASPNDFEAGLALPGLVVLRLGTTAAVMEEVATRHGEAVSGVDDPRAHVTNPKRRDPRSQLFARLELLSASAQL